MRSGIPAWKRLIHRPRVTDERISLIMEIFANNDEIEAVEHLCGEDAQSFIDVLVEVPSSFFHLNSLIDYDSNFHAPLIRHWTVSSHCYRGSV